MKEIMDYLYKAEGDTVHYNENEKDITSPGGVYRYAHPDARVFKIIDRVAAKLGIVYDSKHWTKVVLNRINEYIADNKDVQDEIYQATVEFYEGYLKGARLELFPSECHVAMMSMYTNSPKGAWMSVQNSIIHLVKSEQIELSMDDISVADGFYGNKTKKALEHAVSKVDPMYLETLMLFNMLQYYVKLDNPTYIKGWMNRLDKLASIR